MVWVNCFLIQFTENPRRLPPERKRSEPYANEISKTLARYKIAGKIAKDGFAG